MNLIDAMTTRIFEAAHGIFQIANYWRVSNPICELPALFIEGLAGAAMIAAVACKAGTHVNQANVGDYR